MLKANRHASSDVVKPPMWRDDQDRVYRLWHTNISPVSLGGATIRETLQTYGFSTLHQIRVNTLMPTTWFVEGPTDLFFYFRCPRGNVHQTFDPTIIAHPVATWGAISSRNGNIDCWRGKEPGKSNGTLNLRCTMWVLGVDGAKRPKTGSQIECHNRTQQHSSSPCSYQRTYETNIHRYGHNEFLHEFQKRGLIRNEKLAGNKRENSIRAMNMSGFGRDMDFKGKISTVL